MDRLLQLYISSKGGFGSDSHHELGYCKSLDEYYRKERKLRTKNIVTALWHAAGQIPAAVYEETGEALDEVLSGILPAILIALAVVAGTTLVGISAGALVGAIAGVGVGAVPGAVAGGHIGFSAGVWILEWMGLAFLAVYVGKNLHEVTWLLERGFNEAWGHGARDRFCMDTHELIYGGWNDHVPSTSSAMRASKYFARAVAVVIRLVLEGIVLYITARGVAKLPELVAQLKSSRLGPGFAGWVEKNHLRLMNNPKLKRSTGTGGAAEKPAKVLDHTNVSEQPRPGSPGSSEHKAARWKQYQNRGGQKSYEAWSKQYDTNMKNYRYGALREAEYRTAMEASEGTLKTPLTNRQIDILKSDEMYAGQLKTGPVSLTKENALAMQKDAELVKQGWEVEHILEKGASKPYLDALDKAGINYSIGPKIP